MIQRGVRAQPTNRMYSLNEAKGNKNEALIS